MSAIEFLKDIINIPSLSGKEEEVAERVKKELELLDYDEVFEAGGNVCGRNGNGCKVILYDAHMDIVEPGEGWTGDPYQARSEDGYIIGRGACDDKGALASMVYGLSGVRVDGFTIYVLASVNEEVAEGNGLKEFFKITGIKPDYVVIGEPSQLRLARGNRGRLGFSLDISGKPGHASDPHAGINAIYRSVNIIDSIKQLNGRLTDDSVVVTKVSTPNTNLNIIPEQCSIVCDYRSGVGKEKDEILNEMKDVISENDDIKELTPYYKPWYMEDDSELLIASCACLKEVIKSEEVILWVFCTNGSYTAGELGIPTIGFGPGVESDAHTRDERIKEEDVIKAADFYSKLPEYLLKELAGS